MMLYPSHCTQRRDGALCCLPETLGDSRVQDRYFSDQVWPSGYAIVSHCDERVLNALCEDDETLKENERAGRQ